MQWAGNPATTYLGFDRNDYPGDARLIELRKVFSFTSYWLNVPPSESVNTWAGKRRILQSAGFGFLVLFNGRTFKEVEHGNAAALGKQDAVKAAHAAKTEGFPRGAVIFLDQEEGGRLLAEQREYLHSWFDGVSKAGFRPGVYCSGIKFREPDGTLVTTAEDIRDHAGGRKIVFWVTVDTCPPSPGCSFSLPSPEPSQSGIPFAEVWQFAQSPRRPQYTSPCRQSYHFDGNCYPPDLFKAGIHVDLNTANSADPSAGRTRRTFD